MRHLQQPSSKASSLRAASSHGLSSSGAALVAGRDKAPVGDAGGLLAAGRLLVGERVRRPALVYRLVRRQHL